MVCCCSFASASAFSRELRSSAFSEESSSLSSFSLSSRKRSRSVSACLSSSLSWSLWTCCMAGVRSAKLGGSASPWPTSGEEAAEPTRSSWSESAASCCLHGAGAADLRRFLSLRCCCWAATG